MKKLPSTAVLLLQIMVAFWTWGQRCQFISSADCLIANRHCINCFKFNSINLGYAAEGKLFERLCLHTELARCRLVLVWKKHRHM